MKWVNLTDILVFRTPEYSFVIEKEFSLARWQVTRRSDMSIIAKGSNARVTQAKQKCKEIYKELKQTELNRIREYG